MYKAFVSFQCFEWQTKLKITVAQCNGFINDNMRGITLLHVSLLLHKKHKIVNKKHVVGKVYCISNSLKIMGVILSANLSNWEAKKLFEWDCLWKPIFLGIFVNHFKLHNNNMITLKIFDFIPALLWDIFSQVLFSESIQSIKTTKILSTFSSIQSSN